MNDGDTTIGRTTGSAGRQAVLDLFAKVRCFEARGERAPNKPLLLLYALGRLQADGVDRLSYAETHGALAHLLRQFGRPRQTVHPEQPFGRLTADGIWQLELADHPSVWTSKGDLKIGAARTIGIRGGLTRGPRGFPIETRPWSGTLDRDTAALVYLVLVAVLVIAAFLIVERLRTAPFGRVLRAIRDDEVVPATLGKNVFAFRVQAFAVGAALIAAAGSLYAHWVQSISPDHFTTALAIGVWMSLIVGGTGNNRGILLGATLVMVLLEGSRFLSGVLPGLDAERLSALRIVVIGVLIIVMVRFRPQGLLPEPVIHLGPAVTHNEKETSR